MKLFIKIISLMFLCIQPMLTANAQNTNGNWTLVGPSNLPINQSGQINGLGRVMQVKFHPTNSQRVYACTVGGLFISTNGGASYNVTGTDKLSMSGVTSVCINPVNDNILYIGIGDVNFYWRYLGIYKSTDGGVNWSAANSGIGNRLPVEILMLPGDPNTLISATDDGIWKSTDAGATWTVKKTGGAFRGMVFQPGSSTVMFAVTSNSFWRSTNAGNTWTQITSVNPVNGNGGALAVTPANTNTVYAGFVGSNTATGNGGIIYRSTDGGLTFTMQKGDVQPNLNGYTGTQSGQGDYNWTMCADPTNANIVYVGAHCNWKSTNGGSTWTLLTNWWEQCHTDMHHIFFSPYNNSKLYNANDGGVFVSTDGGANWSSECNGLACHEAYHFAQDRASSNHFHTASQDNGGNYVKNNVWYNDIGGDETSVVDFDYRTPAYLYSAGEDTRRLNEGTIQPDWISLGFTKSADLRFAFTSQNTSLAYISNGTTLLRTTNLTAATPSWTTIKTFTANVTALAVSPSNTAEVYAVLSNSQVYRSTNATAASPTFSLVSTLPVATSSNYIVLNIYRGNTSVLYAVASNSVFRSANNGTTWTNVTGSLPSTEFVGVVTDPYSTNEAVYVASNLGVYYKDNTTGTWQSFANGLPTISKITGLNGYFDGTANSRVSVCFYGRGVWQSPLRSSTTTPPPTSSCSSPAVIAKTGWTLLNADSQEPGNEATKAFDSNNSTMWHTTWSASTAPYPHEIQIDMGASNKIYQFKYLPRQDGNANGRVANYEIYVSDVAGSWGTAVATGTFANDATEKTVTFTEKTGRYLRFRALSEVNGNPWAAAAEISVVGCATGTTPPPSCTTPTDVAKTAWSLVYADSQEPGNEGAKAFDGSNSTMWHTTWSASTAPYPHEIQINLGSTYNISQFKYLPRQDGNTNGRVANYEIYISDNTTTWGTPVATGTFANSATQKTVNFTAKTGRYVRFRALSEVTGKAFASAAEINVTGCLVSTPAVNQPAIANPVETKGNDLKIVPNPARDNTTIIIYSKESQVGLMQVVDATGKVIMFRRQILKPNENKVELNTSLLSAGVYYVTVRMNEKTVVKKLVVQK